MIDFLIYYIWILDMLSDSGIFKKGKRCSDFFALKGTFCKFLKISVVCLQWHQLISQTTLFVQYSLVSSKSSLSYVKISKWWRDTGTKYANTSYKRLWSEYTYLYMYLSLNSVLTFYEIHLYIYILSMGIKVFQSYDERNSIILWTHYSTVSQLVLMVFLYLGLAIIIIVSSEGRGMRRRALEIPFNFFLCSAVR